MVTEAAVLSSKEQQEAALGAIADAAKAYAEAHDWVAQATSIAMQEEQHWKESVTKREQAAVEWVRARDVLLRAVNAISHPDLSGDD